MIAQMCVCMHSKRVYYASTASVWFVRDRGGGGNRRTPCKLSTWSKNKCDHTYWKDNDTKTLQKYVGVFHDL